MPPSMLAAVLADCKEEERMREVFAEHRPTIVFHAAAYKHVGLMEANPVEAVRNNAIATRVVAHVAGELGVERFVLVSTDKAVAPATVMGASKALAEFALEAAAARFPDTRYAAVRFGNVLGSSGSVVPIFRRQIERGGPVTVTDERMTRYFMTIPEAVQLIIRSGSLAGAASACGRPHAGAARRAAARGVRARHGRAGEDRRSRTRDDRAVGPRPRPRHRDRDRRRRARREAARGAVQQLRAPAADRRREDPARRARAARRARRSRRCSPRSGCSCSRATRRAWRRRCPSCRRAPRAGADRAPAGAGPSDAGPSSATER